MNSVHGKELQAPTKVWVQPKKTYINRRVKTIQKEVNKLNKDGNIYNNLLNIPEIPDLDKIKKYFTKTVTAQQCRDALDRLDKWVAKEKASKTAAKIRENILLKAERRRQKRDRELREVRPRPLLNRQETVKKIQKELAVARRKMTQIFKDQVSNLLKQPTK